MSRITLAIPNIPLEIAEAFTQIETFLNESFPDGVTSAIVLNKDHWINARIKQHGMMVTLTDNNKTVWASGNGPTDPWVDALGVSVYVPI